MADDVDEAMGGGGGSAEEIDRRRLRAEALAEARAEVAAELAAEREARAAAEQRADAEQARGDAQQARGVAEQAARAAAEAREDAANQRVAEVEEQDRGRRLRGLATGGLVVSILDAGSTHNEAWSAALAEINDVMTVTDDEMADDYFRLYGTLGGMGDHVRVPRISATSMSNLGPDLRRFNPTRLPGEYAMVFCGGALNDDAIFAFLVEKLFGGEDELSPILDAWSPQLQKLRLAYLKSDGRLTDVYNEVSCFHPVFRGFANALLSAVRAVVGNDNEALVLTAAVPGCDDFFDFGGGVEARGKGDVLYVDPASSDGDSGELTELKKPFADLYYAPISRRDRGHRPQAINQQSMQVEVRYRVLRRDHNVERVVTKGFLTDGVVGWLDVRLDDVHYIDEAWVVQPRSYLLRLILVALKLTAVDVEKLLGKNKVERRNLISQLTQKERRKNETPAKRSCEPSASHSRSTTPGGTMNVMTFDDPEDPYEILYDRSLEIQTMRTGRVRITANSVRIGRPEDHKYWSTTMTTLQFPEWARDFLRDHFFDRRIVGGSSSGFIIEECLGLSGSYGATVRAKHIPSSRAVAIKLEPTYAASPLLAHEKEIYDILAVDRRSREHIPQVHWFGLQDDFRCLVTDLLGSSLSNELDSTGKALPLADALEITVMLLFRLEFIHSMGILYRDVKPSNICRGRGDRSREIFVIDFGVAKRMFLTNGDRVPFTENHAFVGTHQFASRAAHFGIEQCPWDDLESAAYTLLALLGVDPDDEPMATRDSAELCDGHLSALQTFLDECRGTTDLEDDSHFAERFQRPVDYAHLRHLLDEAQLDRPSKMQKTTATTISSSSPKKTPQKRSPTSVLASGISYSPEEASPSSEPSSSEPSSL